MWVNLFDFIYRDRDLFEKFRKKGGDIDGCSSKRFKKKYRWI